MSDQFTEITSQSWGSRLLGSIKGVLFGAVLIAISAVLIWWNEGRAVETEKSLEEGFASVVEADGINIEPANEGKMICFTAKAYSDDNVKDREFNIDIDGLKLFRAVETYQWSQEEKSETDKKVGGGTETKKTYSYSKIWSPNIINSGQFEVTEGHENPGAHKVGPYTSVAADIMIGPYPVTPSLLSRISNFSDLHIDESNLPEDSTAVLTNDNLGNLIYFGRGNLSNPEIGDSRVRFRYIPEGEYTVVAEQSGKALRPFTTSSGYSIELLKAGNLSSEQMLEKALEENSILTWVLRVFGVLLSLFGFMMILSPLVVVADFVPIIGSILGYGAFLIALILSFFTSFLVAGIAWVYYRPIIGISLLVVSLIAVILLFVVPRRKKVKVENV